MVDSRIALQRRPSGVGISGIGQFSLMMMLILQLLMMMLRKWVRLPLVSLLDTCLKFVTCDDLQVGQISNSMQ